jgi:hypothetical protein
MSSDPFYKAELNVPVNSDERSSDNDDEDAGIKRELDDAECDVANDRGTLSL